MRLSKNFSSIPANFNAKIIKFFQNHLHIQKTCFIFAVQKVFEMNSIILQLTKLLKRQAYRCKSADFSVSETFCSDLPFLKIYNHTKSKSTERHERSRITRTV